MNLASLSDLFAGRGLRLLPGSSAVPVVLLVQLPDSSVAHFTSRGTTVRLARYAPDALTSVKLSPECGCGDHHAPSGPGRVTLRAGAVPLVERSIDGALAFGWTAHEAGLLRPAGALPYFDDLLSRVTDDEPAPVPAGVLVGAR